MSNILLDQDSEALMMANHGFSPTGSGPRTPVTRCWTPFYLSSRLPGKWTECGPHIAMLAVRKDKFHSHLASVTLGETSAPSPVTWED